MTLWEIVKELELLAAVHGWDTEISRWNTCCCYGDDDVDIDEIRVEQNEGFPPYITIG